MSNDLVKIKVATSPAFPYASEGLWAQPVDLPRGLYRIDSVAIFTDGVSAGDLVRCEVNGDHDLVAVEVVERSDAVTILVVPNVDGSEEESDARQQELVDRLADRFGDRLAVEGGMGVLAIRYHPSTEAELFACIADGGARDDEEQQLGDWLWSTVSHPTWPAPEPIAGADELLARSMDLVAVDWPHPDDPVVSRWPEEFVASMRERASYDERTRTMLDERRYVAAVAPALRFSLAHELGMDRVGPQPFPLHPPERAAPDRVDEEELRFVEAWAAAKRADGRVRWCRSEEADEVFRSMLVQLGLDPDEDPRTPRLQPTAD